MADDFGLRPDNDAVIADLAARGRLDGVSVMVHRGACGASTLPTLSRCPVSLGLHLTLVGERPLDRRGAAALTGPGGRLPDSWLGLAVHSASRRGVVAAARAEIRAQLARYDAMGLRLDFVNSHQHVHLLPWIWPVLLEELEGRRPVPALRAGPRVRTLAGIKEALLAAADLGSRARRGARSPLLRPVGLERSGQMTLRAVSEALARLQRASGAPNEVGELVFHPGAEPGGASARHLRWGYAWADEAALLGSPDLDALLAARSIRRVRPDPGSLAAITGPG